VKINDPISRPMTMSRKDALLEAGVSSRQESHWKTAGIFKPELKPDNINHTRFTQRDIRVLRWLKILADENCLGMTIPGIDLLLASVDRKSDISAYRYIDIHTLSLVKEVECDN
jgi:DNA-binding transcriptional MerR regulator